MGENLFGEKLPTPSVCCKDETTLEINKECVKAVSDEAAVFPLWKCLNAHSVRINSCLNVHSVCTNLCLNIHSPCFLCSVILNMGKVCTNLFSMLKCT